MHLRRQVLTKDEMGVVESFYDLLLAEPVEWGMTCGLFKMGAIGAEELKGVRKVPVHACRVQGQLTCHNGIH